MPSSRFLENYSLLTVPVPVPVFCGGWGLPQIGARPGADFAVAFFFRLGPRRLLLDRRDQACSYWPLWGYYDTPIGCFVLCAHLTVPRFFIVTPKNHAKKKPKKVLTSMDNVCIISGRR